VTVIEINESGCPSDSAFLMVEIDQTVGINSFANDVAVKVFPNPAIDEVVIDLTEKKSLERVTLTDVNGKVLWDNSYGQSKNLSRVIIPVSQLKPGLYLVRIAAENSFANRKIAVH